MGMALGVFLVKYCKREAVGLEVDVISTEVSDIETEYVGETEHIEEIVHIEETECIEVTEEQLKYEFVESDVSYFSDALFVGDSRCVGIAEYGILDAATFFVIPGMSIHSVWNNVLPVEGIGDTNLQTLLETNTYGKIYIMLGYNELGYNQDYSARRYQEALDRIHEMQSDAIIYICANLHVTEALSSTSDRFNNVNIDSYNEKLRALADEKTYFYLDINEKFDDENGNLGDQYSGDDTHLYVQYYKEWSLWLCERTIVK